jgi:hypothetical protein
MSDPNDTIVSMWTNDNLINEDVLRSLTVEQLLRLTEMLAEVK